MIVGVCLLHRNIACKQSFTPISGAMPANALNSGFPRFPAIWLANCTLSNRLKDGKSGTVHVDSVACGPLSLFLAVATFTVLRSRAFRTGWCFPFWWRESPFPAGFTAGAASGIASRASRWARCFLAFSPVWAEWGWAMSSFVLPSALGSGRGTHHGTRLDGHRGRYHGSVLGRRRRISRRIVPGNRRFGLRPEKARIATGSGLISSNPQARKMPYAPAIAIGTLVSFFAR